MELGRGPQPRRAKHRATPSGFPSEGPIRIDAAYEDLSHHAFAVWMRLMLATEDQLKRGRGKLAKLLNYSEGRSNTVLRELKRKGYITWITHPGRPSICVLERRALISGKTNFVRLSNLFGVDLGDLCEDRNSNPHYASVGNPHLSVPPSPPPAFLPTYARILTHIRPYSYPHTTALPTHSDLLGQRRVDIGPCDLATLRSILSGGQKAPARRKFVAEGCYLVRRKAPSLDASALTYKERIRQKVLLEKGKRETVRSVAKRSVERTRSTKIDFSKLDQRGDPAVSFDPDSPLRDQMLEIISRPARDSERKKLMSKLGTEFGRIYTRYRRQAESAMGKSQSIYAYGIPDKEKAYAADAGMWCVIKGVTPRDLLEYWHKHIKTFADRRLKVPPLSLMKSPGMVDQVACSTLEDDTPEPEVRKNSKKKADPRPDSRNSFSDEDAFDRRLRRNLERAGFDTQDYSDRYLMTLQQLAMGIAKGKRLFVSAAVKPMVDWAAENMYS